MALRTIAIHQSLVRPILLGGAERAAALLNGIFCASFGMTTGSVVTVVICIIGFFVVHQALVALANVDPQWLGCYSRHIKLRDYYPAQSSPWLKEVIIHRHI